MPKSDRPQRLFGSLGHLAGGELQVIWTKGYIIVDRLGKKLAFGLLHHVADKPVEQFAFTLVFGVVTCDDEASRIWFCETAQQAHERRFARSRLADKRRVGALLYRKIEVEKGCARACTCFLGSFALG